PLRALDQRFELGDDVREHVEALLAQEEIDEHGHDGQRLAAKCRRQRFALVAQTHLGRRQELRHPRAGLQHAPHRLEVVQGAHGLAAFLRGDEERTRVARRDRYVLHPSFPATTGVAASTSSMNSATSLRWAGPSISLRRIFSAARTERFTTCSL